MKHIRNAVLFLICVGSIISSSNIYSADLEEVKLFIEGKKNLLKKELLTAINDKVREYSFKNSYDRYKTLFPQKDAAFDEVLQQAFETTMKKLIDDKKLNETKLQQELLLKKIDQIEWDTVLGGSLFTISALVASYYLPSDGDITPQAILIPLAIASLTVAVDGIFHFDDYHTLDRNRIIIEEGIEMDIKDIEALNRTYAYAFPNEELTLSKRLGLQS